MLEPCPSPIRIFTKPWCATLVVMSWTKSSRCLGRIVIVPGKVHVVVLEAVGDEGQ